MKNHNIIYLLLTTFGCNNQKQQTIDKNKKPNIIYILADDMGFGKLSLITLLIAFVVMSCQPQTVEIYIRPDGQPNNEGTKESPYGDIQRALSAFTDIKKSNENAKAIIHVSEGEYRLSQPLEISEAFNGVSIKGEGSDKVIIKGSEKLDLSWNKHNDNIFVADIPSRFKLDQLYANGQQQILARYPNYNEEGGQWQGHAADAIDPERIQHWKQPKGAIIHAMHRGVWGGFHYVISAAKKYGADGNGNTNLPQK